MKYCSHCGKEIADEAFVCPYCGCKTGTGKGKSLSPISIVGFVLAFIMPVVGLIVSIVANSGAKRDGDEKSAKFARAGIIISVCLIALYVIIIVAGVSCMLAAASSVVYY